MRRPYAGWQESRSRLGTALGVGIDQDDFDRDSRKMPLVSLKV